MKLFFAHIFYFCNKNGFYSKTYARTNFQMLTLHIFCKRTARGIYNFQKSILHTENLFIKFLLEFFCIFRELQDTHSTAMYECYN